MRWFLFGVVTMVLGVLFVIPAATRADDSTTMSFGSGLMVCQSPWTPVTLSEPLVVTDCTQAGLQAALDQGGHITFACGPNPVTIPLGSQLQLSTSTDTVLDGQGLVTLDGQNQTRLLFKDWHNPDTVGTVNITLQNLRFINALAPSASDTGGHSGGAINVGHPGTSLHIFNSTFQNNRTTEVNITDNQGGALFVSNSYETVIVGSVFENNVAGNGGAFGGIATGLFVFNSRFDSNQAVDDSAGGIVRGYGGAIHLDGVTNSYNPDSNKRVWLCGNHFEANTAIRGGGATVVTVSDNKGTRVTYERSTFLQNEVFGRNGEYGQGGAIYHIEDDHAGGSSEENLDILQSTFENNRARRQGGAAWLYINGRGYVTNSTFESNTTTAPFNEVGQGGAMAITRGQIDIVNSTFANNHAAYQAGAIHGGGGPPNQVITLRNTIFLDNTLNEQDLPSETRWQGYHTNRRFIDGGQNIQHPRNKPTYNNDVNNWITDNPIFEDPLLTSLADNGGFNKTMALRPGSPAIDAGTGDCAATDQRDVARQGPCDIGAYEYVANAPPGFSSQPVTQAVVGRVYSSTLQANDPDGDVLTMSVVLKPAWLSFSQINSRTAYLQGTPAVDDAGQTPVQVQAVDSGGLQVVQAFTLTVLAAEPQLGLSKTVQDLSRGDLPFGEVVAYTLQLQNQGPVAATSVRLSDTLPSELEFGGWVQQNQASYEAGVISWGPEDLAAGAETRLVFTATFTRVGTLPLLGQSITNTVQYRSDNGGVGQAKVAFIVGQTAMQRLYLPLVLR